MLIKSIERCFDIIELLGRHPKGMRLSDISANLGLNSSTVHHILNTLLSRNYVSQYSDTKRYTLGFAFLEISHQILTNVDIRNIARPHLEELRNKVNQAVHLSILKDDKVVYIDKINAAAVISLATYVGFSTDAHAAAGGKVLLSGLSDDKLMKIYNDKKFTPYGKKTINNLSNLLVELNRIRKYGYAIDDEEYYEGVRCVAAPIKAGEKLVAAISITGSKFDITLEKIDRELRDMVIECAEKISAELR
jgi:DNA-binding IclR family transcriptional regulator